jgi:hypothetical protein
MEVNSQENQVVVPVVDSTTVIPKPSKVLIKKRVVSSYGWMVGFFGFAVIGRAPDFFEKLLELLRDEFLKAVGVDSILVEERVSKLRTDLVEPEFFGMLPIERNWWQLLGWNEITADWKTRLYGTESGIVFVLSEIFKHFNQQVDSTSILSYSDWELKFNETLCTYVGVTKGEEIPVELVEGKLPEISGLVQPVGLGEVCRLVVLGLWGIFSYVKSVLQKDVYSIDNAKVIEELELLGWGIENGQLVMPKSGGFIGLGLPLTAAMQWFDFVRINGVMVEACGEFLPVYSGGIFGSLNSRNSLGGGLLKKSSKLKLWGRNERKQLVEFVTLVFFEFSKNFKFLVELGSSFVFSNQFSFIGGVSYWSYLAVVRGWLTHLGLTGGFNGGVYPTGLTEDGTVVGYRESELGLRREEYFTGVLGYDYEVGGRLWCRAVGFGNVWAPSMESLLQSKGGGLLVTEKLDFKGYLEWRKARSGLSKVVLTQSAQVNQKGYGDNRSVVFGYMQRDWLLPNLLQGLAVGYGTALGLGLTREGFFAQLLGSDKVGGGELLGLGEEVRNELGKGGYGLVLRGEVPMYGSGVAYGNTSEQVPSSLGHLGYLAEKYRLWGIEHEDFGGIGLYEWEWMKESLLASQLWGWHELLRSARRSNRTRVTHGISRKMLRPYSTAYKFLTGIFSWLKKEQQISGLVGAEFVSFVEKKCNFTLPSLYRLDPYFSGVSFSLAGFVSGDKEKKEENGAVFLDGNWDFSFEGNLVAQESTALLHEVDGVVGVEDFQSLEKLSVLVYGRGLRKSERDGISVVVRSVLSGINRKRLGFLKTKALSAAVSAGYSSADLASLSSWFMSNVTWDIAGQLPSFLTSRFGQTPGLSKTESKAALLAYLASSGLDPADTKVLRCVLAQWDIAASDPYVFSFSEQLKTDFLGEGFEFWSELGVICEGLSLLQEKKNPLTGKDLLAFDEKFNPVVTVELADDQEESAEAALLRKKAAYTMRTSAIFAPFSWDF